MNRTYLAFAFFVTGFLVVGDVYGATFDVFGKKRGTGLRDQDGTVTWSCRSHANFGFHDGERKHFKPEHFTATKRGLVTISDNEIIGGDVLRIDHTNPNSLEASNKKVMFKLQVGGSPIMRSEDPTIKFVYVYSKIAPWSEGLQDISVITMIGTCDEV